MQSGKDFSQDLPRYMRNKELGFRWSSMYEENEWWVCAVHFYDSFPQLYSPSGCVQKLHRTVFICINVAGRKHQSVIISVSRLHSLSPEAVLTQRLLKYTQATVNLYSCVQNFKWTNPFWHDEINHGLFFGFFAFYSMTIYTPGNAPSYYFFRWILQCSNVSDVQIS